MDLEEVADEVYIHFWEILEDKEHEPVRYPEAYLAKMIHHKLYDEIRKRARYGNPQPFSMFEGGTFLEDKALFSSGSGMSDPALEYERKQSLAHFLHRIAYAVSKLPARQKLAMTCELLEIVDNLAWMTDALMIYGVDTEVQWPQGEKAKQRLQASLPPARKAIARRLNVDISVFIGIKQRSRK
ncbi:MAG: sigma factor [Ktedonobacteraceae bacterium]